MEEVYCEMVKKGYAHPCAFDKSTISCPLPECPYQTGIKIHSILEEGLICNGKVPLNFQEFSGIKGAINKFKETDYFKQLIENQLSI